MKNVKLLFYFHGWNSAYQKNSSKIKKIRRFCKTHDFELISRTIDYQNVSAEVDDYVRYISGIIMSTDQPIELVLSGTSLGGWLARIIQIRLSHLIDDRVGITALGFNPAVNPGLSLMAAISDAEYTNYVTGEAMIWTRENAEALSCLQYEEGYNFQASYPFIVFAQEGDEVIPVESQRERYQLISQFIVFSGGTHRFESIQQALDIYLANNMNAFWVP